MKKGRTQSSVLVFGASVGRLVCLAGVIAATLIPAPDARAQTGVVELVEIYDTPGEARGVFVTGNRAYATSEHASTGGYLQIHDVTNPATPALLGSCSTSGSPWMGLLVSGNFAYVGTGAGLEIFDIGDPTSPTQRSVWSPGARVRDLHLVGDLAYILKRSFGLLIADVSDPSSPVLLGSLPMPDLEPLSVHVSNGMGYMACVPHGMQIVDVSNPTAPVLRGSQEAQYLTDAYGSGSLVYAVGGTALHIFDVSNPDAPTQIAEYPMIGLNVDVSGDLVYVTGGLHVFDVDNPSVPVLAGRYESTLPGQPRDISVSGDLAYMAMWPRSIGIFRFQVTDASLAAPTNLTATPVPSRQVNLSWRDNSQNETGFQIDRNLPGSAAWPEIATVGPDVTTYQDTDLADDSTYNYRVRAFTEAGVSSPTTVASATTWASVPAAPSNLTASVRSFNEVFLSWNDESSREDGFAVEARKISSHDWERVAVLGPDETTHRVMGLSPDTDYFFRVQAFNWAGSSARSNEVRVTTLSAAHGWNVEFVGHYDLPGDAMDVFVEGNSAYVVNGTGLLVLDVTNPAAPRLRGSVDTPGDAQRVWTSGTTVFVVDGAIGLQIVDTQAGAPPTIVGAYNTPTTATAVHVYGNMAYLTDARDGLQILDVSDPTSPILIGSYDMPETPSDISVSGGFAYIVHSPGPEATVLVVDVRDPMSPTRWISWEEGGWFDHRIHVADGLAFHADSYYLRIYDVSDTPLGGLLSTTPIGRGGADVYTSGNLAYISWGSSLLVFDVSDPSNPRQVGLYDSLSNVSYFAHSVHESGGLAYVADREGGLYILRYLGPDSPVAPSELTAKAYSPYDVDLAWRDNSYYVEHGFAIERRLGDYGHVFSRIATVGPNVTSFRDTGLLPDSVYHYRVRAFRSVHHSAPSNVAYAYTPNGPWNLVLPSVDFGPEAPIQLQPGDPLVVSALFENAGQGRTAPFWVEVWGSRTGGLMLDRFLTNSIRLSGLYAGRPHSWATTSSLYGIPDGPYTVVYAVDRPGEVVETDERDNRRVVAGKRLLVIRPQTQVDLVVEGFDVSPNPAASGQWVVFSGQVVNRGSEPSGSFWIEFWGSLASPYPALHFFLCDSILLTNLDPGASVALADYPRMLYGNLPSRTFMVGCFADRDDSINELDETNNYAFFDGLTVNQAQAPPPEARLPLAGPDVAVMIGDFEPAAPVQSAPGAPTTFTVELTNDGDAATSGFWVEYWGSRDGGVTLHDFLAASDPIPDLAAGTSLTLVTAKPLAGIPDGPYSVVIVADRPNDVAETDEANNRYTVPGKKLLVIRPPTGANLVLENFTFDQDAGWPGIDWGGSVGNTGTVDSGPFWIEFWVCSGDPDYPWLERMCCDSIRVDNLAPDETLDLSTVSRSFYVSQVPAGQYAIIGFVDRLDNVIETDETDNYAIVREFVAP